MCLSDGVLTREVIGVRGDTVRLRSSWKIKDGSTTIHILSVPLSSWNDWIERQNPQPSSHEDSRPEKGRIISGGQDGSAHAK